MPRKKKPAAEAVQADTIATGTAIAEPDAHDAATPLTRPGYIDGPPVAENGNVVAHAESQAKTWGDPYKAIFASREKGFEMGENRRFKQRVFIFAEKPAEEVLAKLKDAGFTYRANEKAWTIHADADTRKLSDELAREIAGQGQGMSR